MASLAASSITVIHCSALAMGNQLTDTQTKWLNENTAFHAQQHQKLFNFCQFKRHLAALILVKTIYYKMHVITVLTHHKSSGFKSQQTLCVR